MKKVALIILLLLFLVNPALSATENGSVNIGATIPGGGGPSLPTQSLAIVPSGGSISQNCGDVSISFKASLSTYSQGTLQSVNDVPTIGELGYSLVGEDYTVVVDSSNVNHFFNLVDLNVGSSYQYYIKAIYSSMSDINTGTFVVTCAPPTPTISVIAENKNAKITIDYNDQESDISQVLLERKINNEIREGFYSLFEAPSSTQELVDPNIILDSEYCYILKVFNGYQWSNEVQACAQRLLSEVSDLSALPSDSQINISWSNPINNTYHDFIFDSVRLMRSSNDCSLDGEVLIEGDYFNFIDLGLENNQEYYYKIKVKNSYDEYSDGICFSGIPSIESVDYCISNINYSVGDKMVNINWANPTNVSNLFSFNSVKWQKDFSCLNDHNLGENIYNGQGQAFSDTDVINNEEYYYSSFVNYNNDKVVSCGCISAIPSSEDEILICPDCIEVVDHPLYHFFVNGGGLELYFDENRMINVLAGYNLKIIIDREDLPKPVFAIVVNLDGSEYYLSLNNLTNYYETDFFVPTQIDQYDFSISTIYQDQTISRQNLILNTWPWGYVFKNEDERLEEANISLFQDNKLFDGYGVDIPQLTDSQGLYSLMVPNGDYVLRVEKADYLKKDIKVSIKNNIINENIKLIARISMTENIRQFVDNNKEIILSGLTALAFINLFSSTPFFNILAFLQYIFFEPFAWLFGRKRKGWGVVYDSVTKKPIDLAIVRLHNAETKKVLRSKVTDKYGRYNFIVDSGKYYLDVRKPGYSFPSELLGGVKEDREYIDIYYGEEIFIKEGEQGVITANIPLDKNTIETTDKQIINSYNWQMIKNNFSLIGPILALVVFIIMPSLFSGFFVLLHLVLLILFRRLARKNKSRPWGAVFDVKNGNPLGRVVVRIFSPRHNRMIEAQVTDRFGRYGFLVDNNIYYITASKDGYGGYRGDNIDLTNKESEEVVGKNIYLGSIDNNKIKSNDVGNSGDKDLVN